MDKRIAIWGWWQGHNLGDNWIKRTLSLFFPNAEFISTEVQSFDEYDYVICGGGGLFIYDVIAPFNKLNIDVPFGVIGIGAEFEHESNLAIKLCEQADFFYTRDLYSTACMHLNLNCRSYDVTFLKPMKFRSDDAKKNVAYFVWRDGYELLHNEKFKNYIEYSDDKDKWDRILHANFDKIFYDDFQTDENDISEIIGKVGFIVSGRYHGIVAAIQSGLPFIAIDICPKIRALVQECDLEEYCIKISETEKIEMLIKKAKKECANIRIKEKYYRERANAVLLKQVRSINYKINRRLMTLKIIHYGSYWMGENDVVNVMSDDLADECDLIKIDLKAYTKKPDMRIESIEKTPNGSICKLNTDKIMDDVNKYNPDVLIFNSGGLCMKTELREKLIKKNIYTVGISLSDPDVYPYNGAIYAGDFSAFYTNSKYSLLNQYNKENVNIRLLPFAASKKHHFYMPEIEKKFDVVIVGHARPDRIKTVEKLKKMCKVGTYGSGWKDGYGIVNGINHVKAINSGKMYLSFSHTQAGYENVKVGLFEAMACNQVVITSYMEELEDYFTVNKEILCYSDEDELLRLVEYFLNHEDEREAIRRAGYKKFLAMHTYSKRWEGVLNEIYIKRGGMANEFE